ncbi:MAG: TIGR00725 family protein [Bacteroidia bacterium]|nr:TIGR00725 family protein [Bacteroidia bacterium]
MHHAVLKKIGVIGPNKSGCSKELYDFGIELGKRLSSPGRIIVCGGLGGFMEAVCKGMKQSANTFFGQTIGILPDAVTDYANAYVDIPIATGMGIARNSIIINSSDIIIAAGGGAGTLSELAFAWQQKKTVLCVTQFEGWANELAGKNIDDRGNGLFVPVNTIDEILKYLDNL